MLGNSCASYVQLRAGPAIIDKTVEVNSGPVADDVRFICEHDKFVLQGDVSSQTDEQNLYLQSETKMIEFRQTLTRFNETLKKKRIFHRLGIPARDPTDFDIDYVLSIAVSVNEWSQKSDEFSVCKRFAREFCHKAGRNKNILWGLINLAPTDSYASLISGGFTIALAAMEAHEKLRAGMDQSLVRIPKELNKIRRLSSVYIQRDELHKRADEVLVSIFTVLERIIEKLSRTWKGATENIYSKFNDSGGNVQDALQSLSDSIAEFNEEAEVCAQLRMGRMEETGQSVKFTVESTRNVVNETSTKATDIESKIEELCQNQNIMLGDARHIIGIMNQLYSFVASNPAFNAADGTLDRKYLTTKEGKDDRNQSTKLVERWFRSLGDFQPSSKDDIKRFVEHSQTLTLKEQDKFQYIMGCQSFQDWLGKPRSSALCVRAETTPDNIINFMSVSTAMLALTLGNATGFITLSFFCSLRRKCSPRKQDSGALGIVKSLNGQLLKIMLDRKLLGRPPFDKDDRMWDKSTESLKYSCSLLKKLMTLLPPRSVVFVLLDSISRTSGDKGLVDDLAAKMLRIGIQSTDVVIKLLVTDPIPSSHFRSKANFSLHVPDDVDGWGCGMNVEAMKKKHVLKLRDLEELQIESDE